MGTAAAGGAVAVGAATAPGGAGGGGAKKRPRTGRAAPGFLHDAPERRLRALEWHPVRPLLLVISDVQGACFVLEPHRATNWPGPMYPPGFEVCCA